MLQHHLLLICRNFKRYKSSFFINLIGLTAGLTCTLLIYLWVNDEVQMDRFHAKGSQLYQVMENEQTAAGISTTDHTVGILGKTLLTEMPEVEDAVAVAPLYWIAKSKLLVKKNTGIGGAGVFAGKNFFKNAGDKSRIEESDRMSQRRITNGIPVCICYDIVVT